MNSINTGVRLLNAVKGSLLGVGLERQMVSSLGQGSQEAVFRQTNLLLRQYYMSRSSMLAPQIQQLQAAQSANSQSPAQPTIQKSHQWAHQRLYQNFNKDAVNKALLLNNSNSHLLNGAQLQTLAKAYSSQTDKAQAEETVSGIAAMIPRPHVVPGRWQLVAESIFGLQGTGGMVQQYFAMILPTFTLILAYNWSGLVPGGFLDSMFGHLALGLGVFWVVGIAFMGFASWGLHFLSFALPAGVPNGIAPIMVPLELMSFSMRAVSLGIRLFANLTAGHVLLHIISGMGFGLPAGKVIPFASKMSILVLAGGLCATMGITGLEMFTASLQAYVFTILVCLYMAEAIGRPIPMREVVNQVTKAVKGIKK